MNVDTLRYLDRFVGLPVCLVLTAARLFVSLGIRTRSLPKPNKVLILKLSEMGSTVLACPALSELKKRCPAAELFFLVFKSNSAVMHALNLAPPSNILEIDTESVGRLLTSGLHAIRHLLREGIDTTIDMEFFSRLTTSMGFLICRGNRVGFHRYTNEGLNCGDLLTHRVLYSPQVHTSAAYVSLVRSLFERPNDEPYYRGRVDPDALSLPVYIPPSSDVERVRKKLQAAGVPEGDTSPIFLINPNSSDIFSLRKWPLDRFAQLCQRLLAKAPSSWLVITGVASEQQDARHILERLSSSRVIDFTGKTNFRELLALYSLAEVMVTNDSGPAHFAALVKLPTVVLFGPETPRLYSPLGNQHRDLYAGFACSPCVSVYNGKKSPCNESRCLHAIAVEQVLDEMLAAVHKKESHAG